MNFNEISLSSPSLLSLITKKHNDGYDLQQSKLKNMVIDELKRFFVSRNEKHRQENDDINSETNIKLEASTSIRQQTITNKSNQ
jgi:hypothetical protein